MTKQLQQRRQQLLRDIGGLAKQAIFGTVSETYRTCGRDGCRCHGEGPKHGPHLYVSYRGPQGKTTGYYVPKLAQDDVRQGVDAWRDLQEQLKLLADLNKEEILERTRGKKRSR